MNFLSQILTWVLLPVLSLAGVFTPIQKDYDPQILELKTQLEEQYALSQKLGTQLNDIPTPVALFETSLQASIGSSATSMTLVSGTDKDGNTLASSTYAFILDEGSADEEFVIGGCTGTTCQGLIRGVSVLTGSSTVSSLAKPHRRGASVKITDAPILLRIFRLINGTDYLPNKLRYLNTNTFNDNNELITKKYADDLAISGAPDGTTLIKGIYEIAEEIEAASTSPSGSGDTTAALVLTTLISTSSPGTIDPENATSSTLVVMGENSNRTDDIRSKISGLWHWFASTSGTGTDDLRVIGNALIGATTTVGNLLATSSIRVDGNLICYDSDGNNCRKVSDIPTAASAANTFGGSGADGALSVTSGTTTIDCSNAAICLKNYTSISITSTGKVAFSNPHANGTTVYLRSQGAVTITCSPGPCISMEGMGAAGGAGGTSQSDGTDGIGTVIEADSGNLGADGITTTGGTAGAASTGRLLYALNPYGKNIKVGPGSGGAGGGDGVSGQTGQAGGRGAGALVIEVGGAWNFTTAVGISCRGSDGAAAGTAATPGGGGGGGGAGGVCGVIYNTLTASSGTFDVCGGDGSAGDAATGGSGNGGGGGGSGGANRYAGGAGGAGGNGSANGANGAAGSGTCGGALGAGGTISSTDGGGGGGGGGSQGDSWVVANNEF